MTVDLQDYLDRISSEARKVEPFSAVNNLDFGAKSLLEVAAGVGIKARVLGKDDPEVIRMQEEVVALFGDKHN